MAVEALRLAMLPTLNAMSVMGLITIPGMLTGQILAGADPFVAVRYQQILMFLIAASTSLGTLIAVVIALLYLVDSKVFDSSCSFFFFFFFLSFFLIHFWFVCLFVCEHSTAFAETASWKRNSLSIAGSGGSIAVS